jgi:hypothetical protein
MTSTPSSLVLGFVWGLAPGDVEPFSRSLRATGYKGRLGLVLAQYADDEARAVDVLADFSVQVDREYEYASRRLVNALRWMTHSRAVWRAYSIAFSFVAGATRPSLRLARWRAYECRLEGFAALRWGHYYDVLHALSGADQVLLTDVRDVVFQRDPFESRVEGLEVFLEDPSMTLGSQPHNRKWLLDLYGSQELAAIGNEVVSCCGTVAGGSEPILTYVEAMWQEITRRRRPVGNRDQAIHNYLLRRGELGPVTIVPNGQGRVLTMGGMRRIQSDESGTILNDDGLASPILHQYDRHPDLAVKLLGRIGSPA